MTTNLGTRSLSVPEDREELNGARRRWPPNAGLEATLDIHWGHHYVDNRSAH